MKIGIISDLHLGKRNYGIIELENDFYTQYHKNIQELIKNKVNTVIIAGDIFDTPKPSALAISQFQEGIRQLNKNNINVLNIIGNHTMLQTFHHIPADELFTNEFDYQLLNENNKYIQDDIAIVGLPYHNNNELPELKEKIHKLAKEIKNYRLKILVLHQEFQEYCGFSGAKLSIHDIPVQEFDIIICGHIHERKSTLIDGTKTFYIQPGSIERLNSSEALNEFYNGKGITIIDTRKNLDILSREKIINIPPERKYLIREYAFTKENNGKDIIATFDTLKRKLQSLDLKPVVFLTIEDETNSYNLITEQVDRINDDSLMTKFTYYDLNSQDTLYLKDYQDKELPSAREALKEAIKSDGFDESVLDLYDSAVSSDDDLQKVADDLFKKLYPPVEVEPFCDPELDEIVAYFEEK